MLVPTDLDERIERYLARAARRRLGLGIGAVGGVFVLLLMLAIIGGQPPIEPKAPGTLRVSLGSPASEATGGIAAPLAGAQSEATSQAAIKTKATDGLPAASKAIAAQGSAADHPAVVPNLIRSPVPITIARGVDAGSPWELGLQVGSDGAGINLRPDPLLYMPLPVLISPTLRIRIASAASGTFAQARLAVLSRYYEASGDTLVRREVVPFDDRAQIWPLLEAAGFDRHNYAEGRVVGPVRFSFVVRGQGGSAPKVDQVRKDQDSGNPEVDAAVEFALSRSVFFNRTASDVRATYSFYLR